MQALKTGKIWNLVNIFVPSGRIPQAILSKFLVSISMTTV